MGTPICPDCGSGTIKLGQIPHSQLFAGRHVSTSLQISDLYRCIHCTLAFRWPRLDKDLLDDLYLTGSEDAWNNARSDRHDWHFARSFILGNLFPGKKVLDVGCFNGDFLASIKGDYECVGVEINEAAVRCAVSRGINIIGSDFSRLIGSYDCVTAFDVIEHVESPKSFLDNCFKHVASGGYLIVSTGNMESFSFRFMGPKYWYAVVPEHIAFVSPSWFRNHAAILGYEILASQLFPRRRGSFRTRAKEVVANMLYKFSPTLFGKLRGAGFGNIDANGNKDLLMFPPGWGAAIDHFIIVLRKL